MRLRAAATLSVACLAGRLMIACAVAAMPVAVIAATPAAAPTPVRIGEEQPLWSELSVAQQGALKPLERAWSALDARSKSKWVDIAARLPRMTPEARARIQTRMVEWAAMTPAQRGQARQQFKEAEQVSPKERRAQWDAYQTLSADQKRQLAGRAERGSAASTPRAAERAARQERAATELPQQKSNIVPNPALAARPKAVAPIVVQAGPGATTTLLSKRAAPPAHQQAGLPKIAGSANFVDPATLLPQRGPQGAAITAASASAPLPRP